MRLVSEVGSEDTTNDEDTANDEAAGVCIFTNSYDKPENYF
ncbi:MAG: hypothetical protein ABI729_07245 [Chitinophagales bacterium]